MVCGEICMAKLDEVFRRREAEIRRDADSPEGRAREHRNAERFAREEAARLKWEAENPRVPRQDGADAARRGDEREAPAELDEQAQDEWLEGYDAEAPEQEE
jgi:hypothetical protein